MADPDIKTTAFVRKGKRKLIPADVRSAIVARYLAGERPDGIAKAYGVNDWNVSVIVRRAGVSRSQVDAQQLILARGEWVGNTRYTSNDAAFSEITPDSAYWAGFLMADGHVGGNKVHMKLSVRDAGHVRKFGLFVKTDTPVSTTAAAVGAQIQGRTIASSGSAFMAITSPKMIKDLASFGVVERKTYTARAFRVENNRHFWRGMIDGDGSLGIYGTPSKPYLSFVGTEAIVGQFLVFCSGVVKSATRPRRVGKIFSVQMSSGTAYRIVRALYDDAPTSLDRKASIAKDISERFRHYIANG
jgi:hypothetical protein